MKEENKARFPYDETPMMKHFPGNAEDCFDMVNQYGTYEIQRTADTANFFPTVRRDFRRMRILKFGRKILKIWTQNKK